MVGGAGGGIRQKLEERIHPLIILDGRVRVGPVLARRPVARLTGEVAPLCAGRTG